MKRGTSGLLTGTIMATLAAMPAYAQTAPATDPTSQQSGTDQNVGQTDMPVSPDAVPDPALRQATDEDIVVTGSRIIRPNMLSAAPITTINIQELSQRGLGNLAETLSQMPQVTPMLGQQGSDDPRLGPNPIALRDLGPGRTLTLLNGSRIDNDVGIIPAAMLERIDILTGGASAVYGSDAIAGVVNYILKRHFTGLTLDMEASAQQHTNDDAFLKNLIDQPVGSQTQPTPTGNTTYAQPPENVFGAERYYVNLAAGKDFASGKGNISLFVGYRKTEPIKNSKFQITACPIYQNARTDDGQQTNGKWTCQAYDNYPLYWFNPVNAPDYYQLTPGGDRAFQVFDPDASVPYPQDGYNQRKTHSVNTGGSLSYDFSPAFKVDANVLYTQYGEEGQNTQSFGFFSDTIAMNCDNPYMSMQQAQLVCGSDAGVAGKTGPLQDTIFRPNYVNEYRVNVADWRASIHLSGKFASDFHYDASYQQSGRTEKYFGTAINGNETQARLQKAQQVVQYNGVPTCISKVDGTDPKCVAMDVFSSNGVDPSVWSYLLTDGGSENVNKQSIANASISGTLGRWGLKSPWAEDALGVAVVAEHRWNEVSSSGTGAYDWWSKFATTDIVDELGGELQVPLIQNKPFFRDLTVSGAYRVSDYRSLSKLIKTYKLDFVYRPVADIGFRGSINRAIRQGVRQRLEGAAPYTGTFFDPCAPQGKAKGSSAAAVARLNYLQCAIDGMSQAQYDALGNQSPCLDQVCTTPITYNPGGNPNLKPERSDSFTIGMVMQPRFLKGFTASIDYYSINIKGAFAAVNPGLIANGCYAQNISFYCGLITRSPTTGEITDIDYRYQNAGFSKTAGIDFVANYTSPEVTGPNGAKWGSFSLGFNGSLSTESLAQLVPGAGVGSCLGYFGFNCGDPSPRYRHYASMGWDMPWKGNIGVIWRYTSSTINSKLAPSPSLASAPTVYNTDTYPLLSRLPAGNYIDMALAYPLTKKIVVRLNVQNLFDKTPPVVGIADAYTASFMNTFPNYYDAMGRTLRIALHAAL
jgi:iron complex outermembrane receptor protein